jgi:hypothetical protein
MIHSHLKKKLNSDIIKIIQQYNLPLINKLTNNIKTDIHYILCFYNEKTSIMINIINKKSFSYKNFMVFLHQYIYIYIYK